jgi:hypothetical protein
MPLRFFVMVCCPPVYVLWAALPDPRPGRRLVSPLANIRSHYPTIQSIVNTVPLISPADGPYMATWCTFPCRKLFAHRKAPCFFYIYTLLSLVLRVILSVSFLHQHHIAKASEQVLPFSSFFPGNIHNNLLLKNPHKGS